MIDPNTLWTNMPGFLSESEEIFHKMDIYIKSKEDLQKLESIIQCGINDKTKSAWFPKKKIERISSRWIHDPSIPFTDRLKPKYPIYIISKGRAETLLTGKALDKVGATYKVIVEEHEYEQYRANVPSQNEVIILDPKYKTNYETHDPEGDALNLGPGPGPARNFAWDHSRKNGDEKHWVFDDNVEDFYRFHNNRRVRIRTPAMFRAIEDFVCRYKNVPITGLNYRFFCVPNRKLPPFYINTRVYSFFLLDNDTNLYWRGRYNEDTDLCLRSLKQGDATLQFNCLNAGKLRTQVLGGGNTAEFYAKEGTMRKSALLKKLHPKETKLVWKFSREHHEVDYSAFKDNVLIPVDNYNDLLPDYDPEYGMKLIDLDDDPKYKLFV